MKITIDRELCESHGQCEYVAPEVFRLDDDGNVVVTGSEDDALRAQVELAASVCPTLAIRLAG